MCNAAGAIAVTRASSGVGGGRGRESRPAAATAMARTGGSERHGASDHAAVHDAAVFSHLVIGDGTMQQAAIVPHHQIAPAPAVRIDELPLCRMFEEVGKEGGPLGLGHTADV